MKMTPRAASTDSSAKSPSAAAKQHAAIETTKRRPGAPHLPEASREAKRLAATLLEVLAGALSPSDAAAVLEVSLPKFYLCEQRALAAFIAACEPRRTARADSPKRQLELLQHQVERLQRECTRNQALLRAAQRSIGLGSIAEATAPKGKLAARAKRKRRPTARALIAARTLRSDGDTPTGFADQLGSTPDAASPLQTTPDAQNPENHLGSSDVQNPNA